MGRSWGWTFANAAIVSSTYAVALLQVAIALGAVAALTRQAKVLALAGLAGVSGIVVALIASASR